ncbi:helix-turn-helix transcriptional regulator [Rosistilla oblonga]|uniref:helix-turn-helix transcriptional regulator n=1 Tax=Rosistilla oblonga TaxID=2527990 RepID=UPI003A97CEB9
MNPTQPTTDVRQVDRQLLDQLRRHESMVIADLVDAMGVTATAVRQRIDRMLEMGLVQRAKINGGRGRPSFSYMLSPAGHRQAGADPGQLAVAMWQAISELPDPETRKWLLQRVAQRVGAEYREQLADSSLADRMDSMSHLLAEKRILAEFSNDGSLPVLDVHACPYPDLTDEGQRRDMCHLEQEMLSEALGQPMELSRCQLDGHSCCQFAPVPSQ